ncbi:YcxB family protein [Niameybacter massiliensis]|uniref:YcxB family protein n=1 Tax=Holtiella tumoricola TaxID=3018743 RepID=A0AA42J304_9FIRM|nr:YcxB family protein [Holtiella tumoricola]MDA3734209.1 YcxB family protein [Holtiella tumoricola]
MTETNELTVKIKMKISDVWRYNVWVGYRTWFSKILVVIGLGILGWIGYQFTQNTGRIDLFFADNIIWIIAAALLLIGKPFKIWNITASQMQSPVFSGTTEYVFSKENIYLKVGELEDTVSWDTYVRIVETGKDFRFFVDPVQAQLLPKHNMDSETVAKLRELIKAAKPATSYKLK